MTLTHCFARLIAGRCRRFITATRRSRCVSPLAVAAGSLCLPSRRPGSRWHPISTRRASGAAVQPACPCEGEGMANCLPSAHPGGSPIHRLRCPKVQGVPGRLLGRVTPSSASVACTLKASAV